MVQALLPLVPIAAAAFAKMPTWQKIALGVGGYWFVKKKILDPVAEGLNIKDTEQERWAKKKADELEVDAFNPKYWTTVPEGSLIPKYSTTVEWADAFDDYISGFTEDESAIVALFRTMKSKAHVSRFTDTYYMLYSEDLLEMLQEYTSNNWNPFEDNDFAEVMQIVDSLPDYIK